MTTAKIGQRIRDARLKHNIGLRQLAAEIGVAPQSVSDWELGHRNLNAGRIRQVEVALHKLVIAAAPAPTPAVTPLPVDRCTRCGGRIGLVHGAMTCRSCGHDVGEKIHPEPTDVDLRWIQLHDAKAARERGITTWD